MSKNLALAFLLCCAATSAFAQSPLGGKWATDRPADPLTVTDAQRKQSVELEVTVEGVRAFGNFTTGGLGGSFRTFNDGKVTGNKIQFHTDDGPTQAIWTIEMMNDNTVMLYRDGGPLPIVGTNILDLIAARREAGQATPAVQVSAVPGSNPSIRGNVRDPVRALIPGVTVKATNVDTGAELTTVTNSAGQYDFPGVTAGKYTLTASLPGFTTATASNLSIGGTQFQQDFTLLPTPANPTPTTCSAKGNEWCTLLHRAR